MLSQHLSPTNGHPTDVVIVGGGLAGLTAAAFLARAGRSVRVFEKSRHLGGRARTRTEGNFLFNMGPHALYRQGQGAAILGELGVKFSGDLAATTGNYALRQGKLYTLPTEPKSFLSTRLLGLRAKFEAVRLFAGLGSIDPETVQDQTVQEWLEAHIHHPDVRELFATFIRVSTYANAADQQSAGSALTQLKLGMHGVWYLDGGWQVLVDDLRRLAQAAGVTIVTGARVTTIERNTRGGVRAVRLADGRRYPASTVIVAADPGTVQTLVENAADTVLSRWAEQAIPVNVTTLEVGLKHLPRPDIRFVLGIDQPLYYSIHSAYARLAPPGGAMIHVSKYLAPRTQIDPQANEQELEALLDRAQPGWRDVLAARQYLPQMTVSNALVTAARGGRPGRPGPDVPDVPGLYLIGDWVGPTGILSDAALASAKQAAELILTDGSRNATLAKRSASAGETMMDRQAVGGAKAL